MMSDSTESEGIRLQKILARAGIGSRRTCEELIADERVQVDGELAVLGRRIDPATAKVTVDGVPIGVAEHLVHYLMHKAVGVITTADDPQGRPTVLDAVPDEPRVFPVGRLDQDTEGLLLLTNDGDLTHRLTHPSFGVDKEYLVSTRRAPTRDGLRTLRNGVELEDGMTAPAKVSTLDDRTLRIVIHEGRNRQVRRMFEAVGAPVERLVRTRIGPLVDTTMTAGEWRPLTQPEVRSLERAAASQSAPPPGR
jgi:23S rRNA pseudouridine2605 synthase